MTSTTWTQTAGMDSGTDSDTVLSYAEAAAASATASANSATASANSATSSATQASNAAASASSAASSASDAASSASAAQTYSTSSNITTVASNISNVNAVGSNISAVTGVNGSLTEISGVYAGLSNVNTVATDIADVSTVAGISSNVTTVAGIAADVSAVAADATDIGAVANISANINTVAGIAGNVTTVAGMNANISTVIADALDIGSVAGNIANVNAVASLEDEINALNAAGVLTDIGAVADIVGNIATVASDSAEINTVAGISGDVSTVAGITGNIASVVGNAANITTVAGISSNVTTVASNTSDIGTVATNISNVNTVAGISADIQSVAGKIPSVEAALDSFDDRYLGPKSSVPTVDNDGNALLTGALYFNTSNTTMFVWNGGSWEAAAAQNFLNPNTQLTQDLDTNTHDVLFGDNAKAIFGAGDLQIYHDGFNSYVSDVGTGDLYIQAGNEIFLQNTAGVTYFYGNQSGQSTIGYAGSTKLATTSTGIDVTGTVTADSLTVDGDTAANGNLTITTSSNTMLNLIDTSSSFRPSIRFMKDAGAGAVQLHMLRDEDGELDIIRGTSSLRQARFGSNGDISFYEDTGTTPKFFWDASAESLSIGSGGTATPAANLIINDSAATGFKAKLTSSAFNANGNWLGLGMGYHNGYMKSAIIAEAKDGNARANLHFALDSDIGSGNVGLADAKMTITYDGLVGIGTSSPAKKLHIDGASAGTITQALLQNSSGGNVELRLAPTAYPNDIGSTARWSAIQAINGGAGNPTSLAFLTNAVSSDPAERLRIDSSGNVGIGTSSPKNNLDVVGSTGIYQRHSSGGRLVFDDSDTADASKPMSYISNTAGALQFGRADRNASTGLTTNSAESMRIDSSGNVGIGTSSPNLHGWVTAVTLNTSSNGGYEIGQNGTKYGAFALQGDGRVQLTNFTANPLTFQTNNTERMRIDSSGNVIIGDTLNNGRKFRVKGSGDLVELVSTNAGSGGAQLDLKHESASAANGDLVGIINFGGLDSGGQNTQYASIQGVASDISAEKGELRLGVRLSSSSYNASAVVIDSSGNVGIGTSSPVANTPLTLQGPSGYTDTLWLKSVGTNIDSRINIAPTGTGNAQINNTTGTAIELQISGTEAMRIDSSGNLLVGRTSSSGHSTDGHVLFGSGVSYQSYTDNPTQWINRNGTDGAVIMFYKSGANVGNISLTSSATSYNTSSDYRLKEDVQPMVGASGRVLALNPVNFAWKVDGTRVDGFLAHEAQAVVPEAVHGEKDAVDADGNPVYQGIDQSKLVPLLTAALQEALQKIEALEARVTALEA